MRVVIVGAGYAGLACALRLSRTAPENVQITLINASPVFVERIRLHEQAAGAPAPTFALAHFLRGTRVDLRVGLVERIDLSARALFLGDAWVGYDRLVLALGSQVAVDRVPGARQHAFTLDAGSTLWLAQVVPSVAKRGGHVAVVGSGLTGVEVAAELAESWPNLRVSIFSRGAFAAELAPAARAHLRESLVRLGVRVREHERVQAVEPRALRTDAGVVPFDACIWAAGFEAPALAHTLGLELAPSGQLHTDRMLHASGRDDVYVAGDLVTLREPLGDPLPMGCKSAFPTGLHVADNLARSLRGEPERPYVHRAVFFCVSLGRHDGVLQAPSADPTTSRRLWTGRWAARAKQLICRGTRWALQLERRRAALARMWRPRRTPALSATTPCARAEPRAATVRELGAGTEAGAATTQ